MGSMTTSSPSGPAEPAQPGGAKAQQPGGASEPHRGSAGGVGRRAASPPGAGGADDAGSAAHQRPANRIDWSVARTVGGGLVRPAPPTTAYTVDLATEQLYAAAGASDDPVWEATELVRPAGHNATTIRVVDRREWIGAASLSMARMLGDDGGGAGGMWNVRRWGAKLAGAQAGSMLAFAAGSIMGQFDPFPIAAEPGGPADIDTYFIVPNVIAYERGLAVPPKDFRTWIVLHEAVHRAQFAAAPWLRDFVRTQLSVLSDEAGEQDIDVLGSVFHAIRGDHEIADDPLATESGVLGAVAMIQSPEQRHALTQLLVMATLLEGHAEHVMDIAAPKVIAGAEPVRRAIEARRSREGNPMLRALRIMLGMDTKLAQLVRGNEFVSEVVARVGVERFNMIFASAEHLPFPAEIEEPGLWIERVL